MLNILYLDDEQVILDFGKEYLESDGKFLVDTTTSIEKALSLINQNSYDGIISDYLMPEMNGIEFLKRVRIMNKEIPFIFFTGKGNQEVVIDAINNGADFFLEKDSEVLKSLFELGQLLRQGAKRYHAVNQLKQNEEKFRTIADLTTDWEYWLDPDGNFVYLSPSCEQITGYSIDEFRSFPNLINQIISPTCKEIWKTHKSKEVAESGLLNLDFQIIHKNGTIKWINHVCRPIFDNNRYRGRRVSNRDITDKKNAETALKKANKKLHLLSNITRHDILNQIQALSLSIESVKRKNKDPAIKDNIDIISLVAGNIERQITFTRDYQDIGVESPIWQDLSKIIPRTLLSVILDPIEVIIKIPDIMIYADPLLEKVFYNLIDNAKCYGKTITKLLFSAYEINDGLIIAITDDGIGVPADLKEAIFNRKYYHNTGFGLNLSREILNITNITIHENGEPGRGARFEIKVPVGYYRIIN